MPSHLASLDAAVSSATAVLPDRQVTSVLFPNGIVASPRHYVIWTKGTTPITSRLLTPVLIDVETGQVTLARPLPGT